MNERKVKAFVNRYVAQCIATYPPGEADTAVHEFDHQEKAAISRALVSMQKRLLMEAEILETP